jgi:hypothetical protein
VSVPGDQLGADRAALVKQVAGMPGGDEGATLAAKQADLAPTQEALQHAYHDAESVKPPGPADLPQAPNKPLVDAAEYQKFSGALVAMALIAGSVSRGNWFGVSHSLNGALKGYMEGNQQKADEEWKKYQADFTKAVDKHKEQQEDYIDTLNNKKLSINGILAELQTKAAKWDDQALLARTRAKDLAAVQKQIYDMDAKTDELKLRKEAIDNAKEKATGGSNPETQALEAAFSAHGVTLPQGMRSRQVLQDTLKGLLKRYPDMTPDEISDGVKTGAIDMRVAMTEASKLATRAASIMPVEKSIVQPGGFLDQAEKAVNAVHFPDLKKAGEFKNWTMEQTSDKRLSAYKTRVTELRQEYAIVLAKGGLTSDASRAEAEKVVPDIITPGQFGEIESAIIQGIETAKRGVDASIDEVAGRGASGKVIKVDENGVPLANP